jgi:hypothetical protein
VILEIGLDIDSIEQVEELENWLRKRGIPFYVEPANRFNSLEDLECQCEGK